ncbi:MAG: GIY-YIG nuclease family protein [Patescibacteria group bacterium]
MKEKLLTRKILLKTPDSPGVYIFWNKLGKEVYIGKARNLKSRIASYFATKLYLKTKKMMAEAVRLTFIKTSSEFEALLLEANLVRKLIPKYNIELKDDKSPIYIGITNDKYPRILTVRKTQLSLLNFKQVFGPYPESGSVKYILKFLRKAFPYSEHKLGKRACIYSQIGLCDPCPNAIQTDKQRKNYLKNIQSLRAILSGNISKITKELRENMHKASKEERYEEAKEILTKINALDYLTQKRLSTSGYLENPNFAEDLRKEELNELEKFSKVKNLHSIVCLDVAHLGGTYPTASMVTFVDGVPEKSLYRRFNIKTKLKGDTDRLLEVFKRIKKYPAPDLMIVDGGKPQVSAARSVFADAFPVVGLAKQYETLVIKNGDKFKELRLPNGNAKKFMQRLRNEAHRFARSYHHLLVAKAIKG